MIGVFIKGDISPSKQNNILFFKHNLFLPSSCFLVDKDDDNGFIHFNYKPPKSVKYNDFGFIFANSKNSSEFYKELNHGYKEVLKEIKEYIAI